MSWPYVFIFLFSGVPCQCTGGVVGDGGEGYGLGLSWNTEVFRLKGGDVMARPIVPVMALGCCSMFPSVGGVAGGQKGAM